MRVVSNTSPVSNLGRLGLLRERYGRVVVPPAVRQELLALTHPAGRAAVVAGGVLGELLHARLAGRIPTVGAEIARLRSDAHFFIHTNIEAFILGQAGE